MAAGGDIRSKANSQKHVNAGCEEEGKTKVNTEDGQIQPPEKCATSGLMQHALFTTSSTQLMER